MAETNPWGQEWWKRRREREEKTGAGSPFKREHSKHAQKLLLLAAAEGIFHQAPKDRLVQMPEY